jgi:hypothetical protein
MELLSKDVWINLVYSNVDVQGGARKSSPPPFGTCHCHILTAWNAIRVSGTSISRSASEQLVSCRHFSPLTASVESNVALSEQRYSTLCKMTYSIEEGVAIVEAYVRTGSIRETRGIFGDKFPGGGIPAKRAIQMLVKKWRAMGSVHNAPKQRAPAVRTPEVIEDIRRRITQSPNKSTRKLAQQAYVSRRRCQVC